MAEELWKHWGKGEWTAESAGSKPAGYVHELAVKAMSELDLDISSAESKSVEQFVNEPFDLVVTVCDNAKESCPTLPGAQNIVHWPFDDPAYATGSEDEKMEVFRRVRDEISDKIRAYLH
jgi:arsenate reductase